MKCLMNNLLITLAFVMIVIHSCDSILCYVCTNQDELEGKCAKTVKSCDTEAGEDTCLTELRWGRPSTWFQYDEWQYYVNKRCSTSDQCESKKARLAELCTRNSYEAWICYDCCSDNLCNEHVDTGEIDIKANPILLLQMLYAQWNNQFLLL